MEAIPRRRLISDFATTFGAALVLFALSIPLARLLAVALGAEGYGHYQMLRRVTLTGYPIALIGLHIALVRALAMTIGDRKAHAATALGGLAIAVPAVVLMGGALLLCPGVIGRLLHGPNPARGGEALLWLFLSAIGYAYLYSAYRGSQRILYANLITIVYNGLIPLGCILAMRRAEPDALILMLSYIAIGLEVPFLAWEVWRAARLPGDIRATWNDVVQAVGGLLRYGWRRMFVPSIYGAFYLVAPNWLNHLGRPKETGAFFLSLTVLRLLEQSLSPIAVVMLPALSEMVGRRDTQSLGYYVSYVVSFFVEVALFMGMQGFAFAGIIVRAWFGPSFIGIVPSVQLLMLALAPLLLFLLSLTVVEALTERAVSLVCALAGLIVNTLIVIGLSQHLDAVGASVGFGAAVSVAAALMCAFLVRRLKPSLNWGLLAKALVINLALAGASWIMLRSGLVRLPSPAVAGAWAVVVVATYLLLSRVCRLSWYVQVSRASRPLARKGGTELNDDGTDLIDR